jgi:TonB family protein
VKSTALSTFFVAAAIVAAAEQGSRGASSSPRLVRAEVGAAAWNAISGGIAAFDVRVDEKGAVTAADMVQDAAPYGAILGEALGKWSFEPAREEGTAVVSRVLVLGFFRPPALTFAAPENPRYKGVTAPPELPWPTSVVVPPYPANAVGSGKVILEAEVSSSGTVTSARVVSSTGPFDSASVASLQQWKFKPASRGNRDVASRAFFVFSFVGTTR